MIGLLPILSDNVPKSNCPNATKTMKKVSTNCVISAETSKLDFIIVKEGVISVIPTTEPAFASARIIIEKFDNPNMLAFRIYKENSKCINHY